jgi:hypothetical protein
MSKKFLSAVIALSFTLSACSLHNAYLNYDDYKDRMIIKNEALTGQDLGPVKGDKGGAIWDDCATKARAAITQLIEAAAAKGANAVGNVKWYTEKSEPPSNTPVCRKSWGYFAFPVFVLTPLFMVTRVDGTAYKTDAAKAKKAGLLMLPTNKAELDAFVATVMGI